MEAVKISTKTFGFLRYIRGTVAVIFFALCAAGCATFPGSGAQGVISSESDQAALKKELANDSFPTARQAGIVSNVTSKGQ